MKKIIIILLTLLMLFSVSSCGEKEITANDVADSIADISSDSEGNVTISLVNGKTFSLGNLKGEKGDKGDPGIAGTDGLNGKNGTNGTNGLNGSDGKDGANGKNGVDAEIGDYKVNITYDVTVNPDHTCPVSFNETYYYDAGNQIYLEIRQKEYTDENGNKIYFAFDYESLTNDYPNIEANFLIGQDPLTGADTDYVIISGTMPNKNVNIHINLKQKTKITIKNTLDIDGTVIEMNKEYNYSVPSNATYFIDDSCTCTGLYYYDDKMFVIKIIKWVDIGNIPPIDTACTREYKVIGCTESYSNYIKWANIDYDIMNQVGSLSSMTYNEYRDLIKSKLVSMGFNESKITFIKCGFDVDNKYNNEFNIRIFNTGGYRLDDNMSQYYLDNNKPTAGYYYSPDIELYVYIDGD